ncbi:MAG: hypothetical protein WC622_10900, partial [Pedobacter sp.]|uniref:hypothetical protein n=1 Tax=Pedobacter sp. TaxID=1411316 RepID=UPI003562B92A
MKMKRLCWGYFLMLFLALPIFQAKATLVKPLKSTYGYSILDLKVKPTTVVDLQINVTQPTCSTPTGTITVVPDASSTGNTYSINGTDYFSSGAFTNIIPGAYIVTVKNALGVITQTTPITVSMPSPPTIALASAMGTDGQSACEDIAIQPITYAVGNSMDAIVTNLPNGVSGKFESGVLTISGTPSEFGYFEYTVTTVSNCNPITTTGTLRIKEATKITLSSAFGTD